MEAFPAFFPLNGARVVIAGDGEGADAKARLLASSPAKVERITGAAAAAGWTERRLRPVGNSSKAATPCYFYCVTKFRQSDRGAASQAAAPALMPALGGPTENGVEMILDSAGRSACATVSAAVCNTAVLG